MKLMMEILDERVVVKSIESKRKPGEKIEIPEQEAFFKTDTDVYPKQAKIGLPRSRNGKGFEKGRYEVNVVLQTDRFGGIELLMDLTNAKPIVAPAAKAA